MATVRPLNLSVAAVEAKDLEVSYGIKANRVKILNGIDLDVRKGSIYGLLGPSGCGKTTLLRCIVGRVKPDQGVVKVFGAVPGSSGSSIPGRGVGYMPQEIALYKEFTIVDILTYYGNLYGLEMNFILDRIDFLVKFLDLPDKTRLIKNLSGGQQRRVSIAVALIHLPPLLILDEPTVGVDPLLRQNIWNHLVALSTNQKMTIIITTHYIEEARQANMVGLLRRGRLLAHADPETLMKEHHMNTLEEVFLKLCQKDLETSDGNSTAIEMNNLEYSNTPETLQVISTVITRCQWCRLPQSRSLTQASQPQERAAPHHFEAASVLRYCQTAHHMENASRAAPETIPPMWRLGLLLIQVFLPAIHAALFCICVGREPFDLKIAVINNEIGDHMGKEFLGLLSSKTVKRMEYNSTSAAVEHVKNGKVWAAISVDEDFTECLFERIQLGIAADEEVIECSTITIDMDMSNPSVTYTLFKAFLDAFQKFAHDAIEKAKLNPSLLKLPLQLNPIYGSLHPNFTECILPGVVLIVIFIMAEALTALSLVSEKRDGLMERDWIAGATETNIILALAMTQFIVMVVQVGFCHFMILVLFAVKLRGSFFLLWLLTILQGACGMTCGLAISTVSNNENTAIMLLLGNFFPNFFLSGIVWPVEAMPYALRYVSYTMPQTFAAEAMRSLFARGWGFGHDVIWKAFAITFFWTLSYLIFSRMSLNVKK
ncbi:ABC transporter G family member 23-like [Centruroides sculpturatus]|uniref:ABC transporter G family member 23-like n=1 Tax=Centruroides sculpturatus TaxID=218467 RepID=UPI000C6D8D73|nr:ABC transporter G family member 23-like [Centruroides sculpturatus]